MFYTFPLSIVRLQYYQWNNFEEEDIEVHAGDSEYKLTMEGVGIDFTQFVGTFIVGKDLVDTNWNLSVSFLFS